MREDVFDSPFGGLHNLAHDWYRVSMKCRATYFNLFVWRGQMPVLLGPLTRTARNLTP